MAKDFVRDFSEYERDLKSRKWRIPRDHIESWLRIEPRSWAERNATFLYEAGITAHDASELYKRIPEQARNDMGRLVNAGRMANLDMKYLHWWAASGLLKPQILTKGKSVVPFAAWATHAREFIVATGGDQKFAALCAAAGLTAVETKERARAGGEQVEDLLTLIALRDSMMSVTKDGFS